MLSHGTFTAKYGTQTTFYVALEDVSATDAPFVGVAPLAADIFLSKDGGATAAATNAMTAIGNGIYSWVATATELSCTRLAVSVYDQTASEIFKPIFFVVITRVELGQLDVDATQIGGNTNAIKGTGVGSGSGITGAAGASGNGIAATGGTSGHGFRGVGGSSSGSGLRVESQAGSLGAFHALSGASATGPAIHADGSGGSNSSGLLGSGVGTGYGFKLAGATAAFYTNLFSQLEGTEPSGMIADNATVMAIWQFIKRRFGNKRTQTSTTFTQYKDDSSTSCWTATVADDGTTQTVGKGA